MPNYLSKTELDFTEAVNYIGTQQMVGLLPILVMIKLLDYLS